MDVATCDLFYENTTEVTLIVTYELTANGDGALIVFLADKNGKDIEELARVPATRTKDLSFEVPKEHQLHVGSGHGTATFKAPPTVNP